jgi:AraC family transcriptional regulator of adaptative response/methylated-DNA-[protein]-cysteine methyltransferase
MNASAKTAVRVAATLEDPRWVQVAARDHAADGRFVYSVKSTGVYCRPSCAARLARPENIAFHASCADAERAGFRPCKRCKPNEASLPEQRTAKITEACRIIETSEAIPDLKTLAARVGLSAYHFHRLFKQFIGLTPRQYGAAQREQKLRTQLGISNPRSSITDAIFDAGYQSSRRFYAKSDQLLGMTPSRYRAGGVNTAIRFALGECLLGSILVAQSERGVCAISLGDEAEVLVRDLQDRFPRAELIGGDQRFEQLIAQVIGFVEAPDAGLDLPLDIRGTAFQQRVWQALRDIPAGSTASYSQIAERIGTPNAVRAVAAACGANTLAVAIPCHRVVRNDGALSGYRWGVERKRALLDKEADALPEQQARK